MRNIPHTSGSGTPVQRALLDCKNCSWKTQAKWRKFPGSHQNIIHGTFSFREGSTLKDVVPDTTGQLQRRGVSKPLTDQSQVWSTVEPSWIGPGPVEGRADTDLLVEPLPSQREGGSWAELCNETCWSLYIFILKKTFNDPNVGGPFTKRKQSAARV